MRIGFDFRPALKLNSRRRGIGRYTSELAKALLKLNTPHEFLLYAIDGEGPSLDGDFELRRIPFLKYPSRLNWLLDAVLLPQYCRTDKLHLFHSTELTSIKPTARRQLWVTVHDLIPYIYWEETKKRVPRDFAYFLKVAWRRVRQANRVITDSEHSKRDICERMSIPADNVDVVYLGSGDDLYPVNQDVASRLLRDRYQIEGPFLLYVGGSDYRKNLALLIGTFAELRKGGYAGSLVLVGETFVLDMSEVREIKGQVRRLGLEGLVLFPGYVPGEEICAFYSACEFFVFPSLYEGFGLPVLEAMKCGAPLLISQTSSLPEVAGGCAHYFNPEEMESLVETFWKAYENPVAVESLRSQGLERAKQFSWSAAAQQIHSLYNQYLT